MHNKLIYILSLLFGFISITTYGQEILNSEIVSFETSSFYDINEESELYNGYSAEDIVKTFTVPDKVDRLLIKIWAAGGGGSSTNIGGGSGDYVQGEVLVTPGETLTINLGRAGNNGVPSSSGSRIGTNAINSSVYRNTELLLVAAGGNAGGITNPENSSTPGAVSGTSIITDGLISTNANGALAPNNTDADYRSNAGIGGKGTNNGWSLKGNPAKIVIKWGYVYPIHLLKINSTLSNIIQNNHKYCFQLELAPQTIYNKIFTLTPIITDGVPGVTMLKSITWNDNNFVPKPKFLSLYYFNADVNQTPNATVIVNKKLPIKITPLSWNLNIAELNNIQFSLSPQGMATWQNRQVADDPQISGYIVPTTPGFVTLKVEGNNKDGEHIERTFIVRIDAFGNMNKTFTTRVGFIPQSTYEKFVKNNNPSFIHNNESYTIANYGGLSMTGYNIKGVLTQNRHNNPNPQIFDTIEYTFQVPQD